MPSHMAGRRGQGACAIAGDGVHYRLQQNGVLGAASRKSSANARSARLFATEDLLAAIERTITVSAAV